MTTGRLFMIAHVDALKGNAFYQKHHLEIKKADSNGAIKYIMKETTISTRTIHDVTVVPFHKGIKLDMGFGVVQPALVAPPVQIELPDNERSDLDDHPSDNSDTPVEDKPEVDVSKLTGNNIYSICFPLVTTYGRNSVDYVFLHMQNEARKSAQTSMVAENKKLAALQESR
ncbi:hypothetical protein Tco_0430808 [Tanacetum coccineum]